MGHTRSFCLSAVAIAALGGSAFAQVGNGGFENPPPALPQLGDWQYNNGAVRDSVSVHGGQFAADLNNQTTPNNVNITQQTAAGTITPGTTYNLSFYTQATYVDAGEGQLQIGFMNSTGGLLPGSPTFSQIPASAGYVQGTRTLVAPANASAFFIAFNAVTGAVPGSSSHLFVDDVVLAPVVAPEPTTLAAFAGASLLLRRRR